MAKKILTTPLSAADLEDIRVGDIIYLTGHIVTCRDVAHRRLIEEGRALPIDVRGGAIFHAGPELSGPRRENRMPLKWFPSAPPPVCGWKSLKRTSSGKPACGLSLAKAVWAREPWRAAGNIRPSTAFSPQAALLLRLRVWRLLKALIGVIWACRKPYGTAGSGIRPADRLHRHSWE